MQPDNWFSPIPDQKTTRIVEILVQEIIPMCGVPEDLLSDRGMNLLSFLMKDVCECLGIEKLNTTAYHPQCHPQARKETEVGDGDKGRGTGGGGGGGGGTMREVLFPGLDCRPLTAVTSRRWLAAQWQAVVLV